MKCTLLSVFFALSAVLLSFFAMIYPAWFSQSYSSNSSGKINQGFGLWAFHSNGELLSNPFYASKTTLTYKKLCSITNPSDYPNWMLGAGLQYKNILCTTSMKIIQTMTVLSASFSFITLICSVIAVYSIHPGKPEKIISFLTLLSALAFSASLIVWGWLIQQELYNIDPINTQLSTCKSTTTTNNNNNYNDNVKWSCWFYGVSFWVSLAAIIAASITGYTSSAGRAEKIRRCHKDYQQDVQITLGVNPTLAADPTNEAIASTPITAKTSYQQPYTSPRISKRKSDHTKQNNNNCFKDQRENRPGIV